MRASFVAALLAAAALAAGSCNKVTSPSQNTTETFNGIITPTSLGGNGFDQPHYFNVPNGGEFTVKVTSMTPSFSSYFGVYMGMGSGCGIVVAQNTFSLVNVQALSGPIYQTGQYCVYAYDEGSMTAVENYTIVVSHP